MKNLNLTIQSPCSENWNAFTATPSGGFCLACKTEVIDFTAFEDEKIIKYFSSPAILPVCGKFRSSQLKNYNTVSRNTIRPGFRLFLAGILVILKK